jgi:hypothetical protein
MDGPDWLRTQLTSFTCPACGEMYGSGRLRLLAEREGLFFVDIDCPGCASHTVAIVTVEADDAEALIADVPGAHADQSPLEPPPPAAAPVTADDVLEMHEFLARFEGDVGSLFDGR